MLEPRSNTKIPVRLLTSDTSVAVVEGLHIRIKSAGVVNITCIQDGNLYYQPAVLHRTLVIDPIWKSWWFLLIIGFWFFVIVYLLMTWRISVIKKREHKRAEIKDNLAKLQMKALKAQMNPHFIFNCLNTINSYIIRSDAELASQYLARFARLIRLVLENSETTIVPLRSELETIDMYLSLEMIRFDKKLSYEIINKGVDDDFEVPSMCLQPFIENAIWHGLLHKIGPGKVTVTIEPFKEGVRCVVEDDGIGRGNAASLRTNPRKSFGLSNTTERLKLLGNDVNINIIDMKDQEGYPIGTKVEIVFATME